MKLSILCLLLCGCVPSYVPASYRADYRNAGAHPSRELKTACVQYQHDKAYWDATHDGFDAVYNSEYNMLETMKGK